MQHIYSFIISESKYRYKDTKIIQNLDWGLTITETSYFLFLHSPSSQRFKSIVSSCAGPVKTLEMDWNPDTLQSLSQVIMLRLVSEPSVEEQIRECAAAKLKSHLEIGWAPSSATPIPDGEKEEIKRLIVPVMLSATPKIQAALSGALAVIGNHDESFAGDEILQQIVIPNVMLRDEEEELFEMSYLELIGRDMDYGSGDVNVRRGIACGLLKGIVVKNKEKIRALIDRCLAQFAENPGANWKYKECAIFLVISLATKDLLTGVDDVERFFSSVIVPELQSDQNSIPMLKAAALRFFTTMLGVLVPTHVAMPYFGDVVSCLDSKVYVVRCYAAICSEKLIVLVKEEKQKEIGVHSQASYISLDISPLKLLSCLFGLVSRQRSSEGDEYVMRCIVRVFQVADIETIPKFAIRWIISVLQWVCEHPKRNPVFNNLVFELLAALARVSARWNYNGVANAYGTYIVPALIRSLKMTELLPYSVQLIAQCVEINTPFRGYEQIFENRLTEPSLWENPVIVRALVRLLVSLLRQAPDKFNNGEGEGRLGHVLGIINKLALLEKPLSMTDE